MNENTEIGLIGSKTIREVDRLFACLDGLTADQLNWRPTQENTNSLAVLATHMMGNLQQNIFVVLGGEQDQRDRDAEFRAEGTSAVELQQPWSELKGRIQAKLDGLSVDMLDQEYDHPRRGRVTGRELLLNAAMHAAEHAGHAELTRDLVKARG